MGRILTALKQKSKKGENGQRGKTTKYQKREFMPRQGIFYHESSFMGLSGVMFVSAKNSEKVNQVKKKTGKGE